MNMNEIKNAVAETAKRCGAEQYEIQIHVSERAGTEAMKQEISSVTYSQSGGISIRCIMNGKSGYASGELIDAKEAVKLTEKACINASIVESEDPVGLFAGSDTYQTVEESDKALPSVEDMKTTALELQKLIHTASDKIIPGSRSSVSASRGSSYLSNSLGLDLHYASSMEIHGVSINVKDGDAIADQYRMALHEKETLEETVAKATETALSKLGAETVASGKYDLILDKNTLRSILGVYAHVFSAKSAYLKTTLYADKEGEMIASPNVTIIDDPFHPEKTGHCPYDGEGVAAYKKNVVENGCLKTLLYNRMYAKLMNKETTGNATDAKNIAPRGLYLAPGTTTEEELLKKLDNGLYITGVTGLHAGANTQTGDFSLQAEGFLVENGIKTRPLINFTIADNFYELLKKIDTIADTVEFGLGMGIGAPEILIRNISVAGK